jgi:hypothetical protein
MVLYFFLVFSPHLTGANDRIQTIVRVKGETAALSVRTDAALEEASEQYCLLRAPYTQKQVAIHVSWYSIMTQISKYVGLVPRKCCRVSRFQLRYQHPVSGGIPWSTTADTDPSFNVFGTASQLADCLCLPLTRDSCELCPVQSDVLVRKSRFLGGIPKSLSTASVFMEF